MAKEEFAVKFLTAIFNYEKTSAGICALCPLRKECDEVQKDNTVLMLPCVKFNFM